MKNNYNIYILIAICFLAIFTCASQKALAQKSSILKSAQLLKVQTRDQIVDIYESQGKTIHVFSNNLGTSRIKEGHFVGLEYDRTQAGIIVDGYRIRFKEGEELLGYYHNQVLTQQINYGQLYSTTLRSYIVTGSALQLKNSLDIPGFEYTFYANNNAGTVLLSNESERYGDQFSLYDYNLKLIREYQPYQNGFNSSSVSFNNQNFVIATQLTEQQKGAKLTLMDALSGDIVTEKELDINEFKISEVTLIGKYILASGYRMTNNEPAFEMMGFDEHGLLLWRKDLILSEVLSIDYNGQTLACGYYSPNITLLDPANGEMRWRKTFADFTPGKSNATKLARTFPLSFKVVNHNTINLLVVNAGLSPLQQNDTYPNANLYLINSNGELIQNIELNNLNSKAKLVESSNKISLLEAQSKTIYSYEKHLLQNK